MGELKVIPIKKEIQREDLINAVAAYAHSSSGGGQVAINTDGSSSTIYVAQFDKRVIRKRALQFN